MCHLIAAHQTPDEAAIAALFRTLEANAPCILFLRESDRTLFASNERYAEAKATVLNVPPVLLQPFVSLLVPVRRCHTLTRIIFNAQSVGCLSSDTSSTNSTSLWS